MERISFPYYIKGVKDILLRKIQKNTFDYSAKVTFYLRDGLDKLLLG